MAVMDGFEPIDIDQRDIQAGPVVLGSSDVLVKNLEDIGPGGQETRVVLGQAAVPPQRPDQAAFRSTADSLPVRRSA